MSENMGEVQTTNTEIIKKKSKTGLIIGTFAGVIAIIGIVMFLIIFVVGSDTRKANKKNELAEKYLTDLDYDNAILAYKEAIALQCPFRRQNA